MTFIPPTNSSGYVAIPLAIDPNARVKQALANIVAQIPGWIPREGHLEVAVIEEVAQMVSVSAQVAAQMSTVIFQSYGQLVGILPEAGAQATAACLCTMVDTAGYTIPAGTIVSYPLSGSPAVLFAVQNAIVIAPGNSTGTGTLVCGTVGTFANGLPAHACQMVITNAGVLSVATTATSSGGANAETQVAYMNRLSSELQLLAPRPILAADYAAMAQNVDGVYRAMAVNGLNPGQVVTDGLTASSATVTSATWALTSDDLHRHITGAGIPALTYVGIINSPTSIGLSSSATSNVAVNATASATGVTLTLADLTSQERYVAVCGVDSTGAALSDTVADAMYAYLQSMREVNFVVAELSPTTTGIDVTVACDAVHGVDTTTVQTAITAALTAFLSPATWGGGNTTPPSWTNAPVVRFLDIANVIHNVPGVLYIPSGSLTLCIHSGSLAATDVTLPGDAPLPTVGTLSVAVSST